MQSYMNQTLEEGDPEIFDLIEHEKHRQYAGLELIASENFTSRAVLEANGSCLTNKYSEGLPYARYYGGTEWVDKIEALCQKRALDLFGLNPEEWGVNVQPYSGSTANFAALTAMLKPNDRLMGLDLPSGGHLTHGYQTATRKISSTSVYFQSMPYQVDSETGLVDYDKLEDNAKLFRPNVLICGGSAYPRDWDYERFRKIADEHKAYLMMDMAHISGLVAAQQQKNPFEYCDVVTSTTHKSLRGPRAAVIFYRKTSDPTHRLYGLADRCNFAVFPQCQGGPHNHQIAAMAVAFKYAQRPDFKDYSVQLIKNAQALCEELKKLGYKFVTDGTDNHSMLWDVRPHGLSGSKVEKVTELASISLNKNSVVGDKSALSPGGVRLGTSTLTTRGFVESDFKAVAAFLDRAIKICVKVQAEKGKLMKNFMVGLGDNEEIKALRGEVEEYAKKFEIPGWDVSSQRYK